MLKSKTGWNNNGNGTDVYGFSALPGGSRSGDVGDFGFWWSATEYDTSYAWDRYMNTQHEVGKFRVIKSNNYYSVRCVQNAD